jgi:hypothetical protein
MDNIPIGDRPADNVVPLRGDPQPQDAAEASPGGGDEEISWEEAVARDAEAPQPDPPPRSKPNADLTALVEQGLRVGLGLAVGAASAAANGLRAQIPKDPEAPPKPEGSEPFSLLTGAFLGAVVEAAELTSKAFGSMAEAAEPVASWVSSPPFLRGVADAAASGLRFMDGRWKAEEASTQRTAEEFVQGLIPQVTGAALDQLDLTSLVKRVDLNAVLDDIDVDRLVESIDIDAILARVDIDEIVQRVDLNAVAAGINVDAIIDRVDLDAIVSRVDVTGIAQQVIEDVDLPSIIRESSGAMAGETVQEVRLQSMGADRFVARVVDRVLRRDRAATAGPAAPPAPSTETSPEDPLENSPENPPENPED